MVSACRKSYAPKAFRKRDEKCSPCERYKILIDASSVHEQEKSDGSG